MDDEGSGTGWVTMEHKHRVHGYVYAGCKNPGQPYVRPVTQAHRVCERLCNKKLLALRCKMSLETCRVRYSKTRFDLS